MQTKLLTQEISKILYTKSPVEIPLDLKCKANAIGIKDIFIIEKDLSELGVYGNIIVVLHNHEFVDLRVYPNVKAILDLLAFGLCKKDFK